MRKIKFGSPFDPTGIKDGIKWNQILMTYKYFIHHTLLSFHFEFIMFSSIFFHRTILTVILFAYLVTSTHAQWLRCLKCPTDEDGDYNPKCVQAVVPPWPICLFRDLDGWVDKAIDSADRCCGHDTSLCRCPKKDTPEFERKMKLWCHDVDFCDDVVLKDSKNGKDEVSSTE